jgi:hypothetical protein
LALRSQRPFSLGECTGATFGEEGAEPGSSTEDGGSSRAEAERNHWRGVVEGEMIGGIGASFATPEEDEQVTKAGLAALRE